MSYRILEGDVMEVLRTLATESVQCCVTSPPYWGLRDYKIAPSVWEKGSGPWTVDSEPCEHAWGDALPIVSTSGLHRMPENQTGGTKDYLSSRAADRGNWCQLCGAWRGCLGLEPTPELYIAHVVTVFREVRRVLRRDGTCWVNMGDSYAHGTPGGGSVFDNGRNDGRVSYEADKVRGREKVGTMGPGLKPKDLVGLPWMLAFALRADGWWLRQDIVWSKPNPMPESVTDRCTKAHEYLFLLTKRARYYYDQEAIKEDCVRGDAGSSYINGKTAEHQLNRAGNAHRKTKVPGGWDTKDGAHVAIHRTGRTEAEYVDAVLDGKRNKRSVWEIATQPFAEAHFATFPEALVEPCVLAGTSEYGCCPACGAPWRRVKPVVSDQFSVISDNWRPTCKCVQKATADPSAAPQDDSAFLIDPCSLTTDHCTTPCVVLDPFAGSGTVGVVALRYGREFVGIELNADYAAMARRRIEEDAPLFNKHGSDSGVSGVEQPELFAET